LEKRGQGRFYKNISFICVTFLFLLIFISSGLSSADTRPIGKGAIFPNLFFKYSLSKEERAYLGISNKKNFYFRDIGATLFIFEVFSTYCTSCPKNVPILNKVYSRIEKDADLKGKVKVIGIAAGNNQKEVETFSKEYKVLYPILTDLNFVAHKALGAPRVPYTVFVRKDKKGKGVVVSTHQGIFDSAESVMKDIRNFIECDPSASACDFKLK